MIESFGPRLTVPSGPAASLPGMQAGEKVVHRPDKKVLPTENVERTAQTGPRPTFQQTYLQQLAAFWPDEPDPPVTRIEFDEGRASAEAPVAGADATAAEPRAAEERPVAPPPEDAEPTVDIRA